MIFHSFIGKYNWCLRGRGSLYTRKNNRFRQFLYPTFNRNESSNTLFYQSCVLILQRGNCYTVGRSNGRCSSLSQERKFRCFQCPRSNGEQVFVYMFLNMKYCYCSEFLEKLKFGIGDGNLQYYLYNWRCPRMEPSKVGLVLQWNLVHLQHVNMSVVVDGAKWKCVVFDSACAHKSSLMVELILTVISSISSLVGSEKSVLTNENKNDFVFREMG